MRYKGFIKITLLFLIFLGVAGFLSHLALALYPYYWADKLLNKIYKVEGDNIRASIPCSQSSILDEITKENLKQAVKHLQSIILSVPRNSQAYLLLGRAYCWIGDPLNAVQSYKAYINLRPQNPLGHLELGFALQSLGTLSGNANQLSQSAFEWKKSGVTAKDFFEIGSQYEKSNKVDAALMWFQWSAEVDPNWSEPWLRMGSIYEQKEYYEYAVIYFMKATQADKNNRLPWYKLGIVYTNLKDWNSALQALQNGIQVHAEKTGLSNFYYQLGFLYQDYLTPKDLQKAWNNYNKAIEIDDFSFDPWLKSETYYQRGNIYALQQKWREALIEYQQALKYNSKSYWVYVSISQAYWSSGDRINAKSAAREAIKLNPGKKAAYLILAEYETADNNLSIAKLLYQKVLEIDPQDQKAVNAIETLK